MVSMPWYGNTSSPSAFYFAIDRELCKDISVAKDKFRSIARLSDESGFVYFM
jgi:hypothetical protein